MLEIVTESISQRTIYISDTLTIYPRTIPRLAVYEIDKDDNVPTSVAINEAVELAKKFGQDNSASFVNGVLAKIVK